MLAARGKGRQGRRLAGRSAAPQAGTGLEARRILAHVAPATERKRLRGRWVLSLRAMLLAHRPAEPLASYVERLWYCEGYQAAHRQERVLPNGRFQLIIDLAAGPSLLLGMRTAHTVIDTAALRLDTAGGF